MEDLWHGPETGPVSGLRPPRRTGETVGWWLIGIGQRLVRVDAVAHRLANDPAAA